MISFLLHLPSLLSSHPKLQVYGTAYNSKKALWPSHLQGFVHSVFLLPGQDPLSLQDLAQILSPLRSLPDNPLAKLDFRAFSYGLLTLSMLLMKPLLPYVIVVDSLLICLFIQIGSSSNCAF